MTDTGPTMATEEVVAEIHEVEREEALQGDHIPAPQLTALELSGQLRKMARKAARVNMRGQNAFATLCQFQNLLIDQEYNLSEDMGYILGGFKSCADFCDTMTAHALFEARKQYQKAKDLGNFVGTLKNIAGHPAGYINEAYKWLKMSNQSLFEDETFAYLGTTHAKFFEDYTRAYIDCARQKIRLAQKLIHSGEDDELGYGLMCEVVDDHLARICGKNIDVDTRLAGYLESSAAEIDEIASIFAQRKFKAIMAAIAAPGDLPETTIERLAPPKDKRPVHPSECGNVLMDAFEKARAKKLGNEKGAEITAVPSPATPVELGQAKEALVEKAKAIKEHPYPYGSFEWHEQILKAMDLIRDNNDLEYNPETYAGTQFTKEQFAVEFEKSAEAILRNNLMVALNPAATPDQVHELIEVFEDMREMYPKEMSLPDDADPAYLHEDYCFWPILREYGLRSFTQLLDQCQVVLASAATRAIIQTTAEAPIPLTYIADNLMDAETFLQVAQIPTDHPPTLTALNIDHAASSRLLIQTGAFSANRDWSKAFHMGYQPKQHIKLLDFVERIAEKLEGHLEERLLNFTQTQLLSQMRLVRLRDIEHRLADDCMSFPGAGPSHSSMKEAFEKLHAMGMSLSDPAIHEAMGMTAVRAAYMEAQYEELQLLDRWRDACNKDNDPMDRLTHLKAVRAATLNMNPAERDSFLKKAGADALDTLPALIREQGITLYRESMADADSCRDDPLKVHEFLSVAAASLRAIHPRIMKSDMAFQRLTQGSRAEFIGRREMVARKVKELTTFTNAGPNWQPEAARVMEAAMNPHLDAAESFKAMERLATNLHNNGRSILDAQLVQMTGMTRKKLAAFMDEKALAAARSCADDAGAKKRTPLILDSMEDHAVAAWRRTLEWVSRMSCSALSDEPWRALGLAGRDDFVDRFRESLADMMKDIVFSFNDGSAKRKGPYLYIQVMKEALDGYAMLGQTMTENARESIRLALRDVGSAALDEVLEDKPPQHAAEKLADEKAQKRREGRIAHGQMTRKYKQVLSLVGFVNRVDNGNTLETDDNTRIAAKYRKNAYAQRMNNNFVDLTYRRVERGIALYDRCRNKPGRGAALAAAINTLVGRVPGTPEWSQQIGDLARNQGFTNFDGFIYQSGMIRMRQLVRRIGTAARGKTALQNPATYIAVMRDLDRIDGLVESRLLTGRDRLAIMKSMELPSNWLTITRRMGAQYVLPHIMRSAQDPTLDNLTRWNVLTDCLLMGEFAGSEMRENLGVDWDALTETRKRTGYRIAAMPLVADQIRQDWARLGEHTIRANTMLGHIDTSLADRNALAAMGLKEMEIESLVQLAPLIPPYNALKTLRQVIRKDLPVEQLHVAVHNFWEACNHMEVDPIEFKNMYGMGFESNDDYIVTIDSNVFGVLLHFHNMVREGIKEKDAEKIRGTFDAALQLMDMSGIEKRYTEDFFKKNDIMLRTDILATYATVVPPDELPAVQAQLQQMTAPKAPAPAGP